VKLLLDTHLIIRAAKGSEHLPAGARNLMEAPENELVFSVASIWEIAIKRGLDRPGFRLDARVLRRRMLDNGYHELTILSAHAVAVDTLPPIHKDPFDRLLIAQSMVEGILLLTDDATVAKYPGPIRLA
jgi:PIN domain nuclease of toxin-antitoxin system